MKKILLIVLLQLIALPLFAQGDKIWKENPTSDFRNTQMVKRTSQPNDFKVFTLNEQKLNEELKKAPNRDVFLGESNIIVAFPSPEGILEKYQIKEASVMEPQLQAAFPEIRSYVGQGVENPANTIRFSFSPQKGLSALIRHSENGTFIIDPYTTDNKNYIVFKRTNGAGSKLPFMCATPDELALQETHRGVLNNADDSQLRRFRLAMSCTGEYTVFHGGTVAGAMAAINASVTRVNGVFENDFNATMVLVGTTSNVVYTNAATDPYSAAAQMANWNAELQSTLTSVIGEANYDIGHLFGATGGGGNAGCIGCVCVNGQKGSGYTSPADGISQGDTFDIDYVAHEMGHQFGGNHTWTHGGSEGSGAQMEPGSGSTIMGYAGITGATDVQPHSDAYFHAITIQQVTNNIKAKACPTLTATGNAVPTANAGADKLFPIGTAFKLTGSGTDANGLASLTYCWEQMDNGDATTTYPNTTKLAGPNFRSFTPTTNTMRRFPRLVDHVANGVNGNMWEIVPGVSRTLNFRFTVRDNRAGGACNESDNMSVVFDSAYGPFAVTSQNVSGTSWAIGSTQTITWTVNNTTALAGSTNVNILLSTDGGVTFPITLIANTPNDGTQNITVPDALSTNCRLLIEPTGNDYYAINTQPFMIGYSVATTCTNYTFNTAFAIPDNNTAYTVKSINVPTTATITDVNLRVNLNHTYVSDLQVVLQNPSASNQVTVFNRSCTSNDNMNVLFDDQGVALVCASPTTGTYLPAQPLSVYNGMNPQGNWLVGIRDLGASDTGTVTSYTLTICSQAYTLLPVVCGAVTSTWNGTTWSNGVPGKNTAVTLSGNYATAVNGSFEACSLTVNAGAGLTIGSNTYVQITNDLTVNATGIIDVLDLGSLVMLSDAGVVTNNGTIRVYKTTTPFNKYDYFYWSAPVANVTLGTPLSAWQLNHAYQFVPANFSDLTGPNGVGGPDGFDDNGDDWSFVPSATVMTPGKGYAVMTSISGTFPRTENVVFNGKVNNGAITQPIALSGNAANANDDWNLIGNPYPSSISANSFITANANISGTLYFWTHVGDISIANPGPNALNYNANDYAMYNLSGGVKSGSNSAVPNGYVASGQGFMVEAASAGNVTFSNTFRSKDYGNDQLFRDVAALNTRNRYWLSIRNPEGMFSQQLIGYYPEATAGVDRGYDGVRVTTKNYVSFYSIIDNEKYGIQAKGAFDQNDVISLGYFAAIAGNYSIQMDDAEGLFMNQDVFVRDLQTGMVHNLKTGPYSFTTTEGTFNSRFEILYQQPLLGNDAVVDGNSALIYATGNQINVVTSKENIKEIVVFDVLGRQLFSKSDVNNNECVITSIKPAKETLFVKVTLQNGTKVNRKVIY